MVRRLPPTPQRPLSTSSTSTCTLGRMPSPPMRTTASVMSVMRSCFCCAVKAPARSFTVTIGMMEPPPSGQLALADHAVHRAQGRGDGVDVGILHDRALTALRLGAFGKAGEAHGEGEGEKQPGIRFADQIGDPPAGAV